MRPMRAHALTGAALVALTLALGTPTTAVAQDGVAGAPVEAKRKTKGPGEVTFDVVERPLKDIIAYIQEKTDVNLVLAKEAEEVPQGSQALHQSSLKAEVVQIGISSTSQYAHLQGFIPFPPGDVQGPAEDLLGSLVVRFFDDYNVDIAA